MPDPRQHRPTPPPGGAHRQRAPERPRHARSSSAAALAQQQRQARLARTVVAAIVVLAVVSALTGYLLHGPSSSDADARPKGPVGGTAAQSSPLAPGTTSRAKPSATASSRASAAHSTKASSTARTSAAHATSKSPTKKPATPPVPAKGNGKFTPVSVPQTTTAKTGRVVTYSLQIEGGMHADTHAIATAFGRALLDKRGWQRVDDVRFVQVTPRQVRDGTKPQMKVLVASPDRVDILCAPLKTHGDTSCDTSAHVVLNYKLWVRAVPYFKGQVAKYREYMVNHEVGHALGHGHQKCSKKGAYAPVMQQQTLGLHGCKPWPWPKRPSTAGKA